MRISDPAITAKTLEFAGASIMMQGSQRLRWSVRRPGGPPMKKLSPPRIRKLPAAKQRRLDRLLEKNSEGTITTKEKAALEHLVAEAEELMVANARQLAKFSKANASRAPAGALPVTVWVQPHPAER